MLLGARATPGGYRYRGLNLKAQVKLVLVFYSAARYFRKKALHKNQKHPHRKYPNMSPRLHISYCYLPFKLNESHVPVVSVLHVELAGRSVASMV